MEREKKEAMANKDEPTTAHPARRVEIKSFFTRCHISKVFFAFIISYSWGLIITILPKASPSIFSKSLKSWFRPIVIFFAVKVRIS